MTTTTFKELSLVEPMQRAIDKMGFTTATAVQAQAIPIIREGVDILAQSQTGTGKTMAFSIPAVESIEKGVHSVQVLILLPTRELALQCAEEVRKLTRYMPHIKVAEIFGGADYNTQFRALKKANFVIGTPGRTMDHMSRGTLNIENLKMIILDEADEMLNMGFKEDIETILKDTPSERQTLLFSATVPKAILDITHQFQKNAKRVNLSGGNTTLKEITQLYLDVPKAQKTNVLKLLMFYYKPVHSIIFANTKSMVDELVDTLSEIGLSAKGLHGDMKQRQRTIVMADFKSGKTEVLIATDVAARGIDVSDIDYVFNYDIPKMSEYYVHRIGRTGRAGRTGTAVTLCCGRRQVADVKALARKLQSDITEIPVPTVESIQMGEIESNVKKICDVLEKGKTTPAQKMLVDTLVGYGYNLEQIAIALSGMAFEKSTSSLVNVPKFERNERKSDEGKRKPSKSEGYDNSAFSTMVLDIGSSSRCKPNHIVGAVTEQTGMSSRDIGKIIIEQDYSMVSVPTDMIHDILQELRGIKICGKPVTASHIKELKKVKNSGDTKRSGDRRSSGDRKGHGDRKNSSRHGKSHSKSNGKASHSKQGGEKDYSKLAKKKRK